MLIDLATSVTSVPTSANAAALASPMPEEAHLTRERLPACENNGDLGSFILPLLHRNILATVPANPQVTLFRVADESLENAEVRTMSAGRRRSLIGRNSLKAWILRYLPTQRPLA